jgi:hypothetical protein
MALYYTLPVYRSTYELIKAIYLCVHHFPKQYKYTLGNDLQYETKQLVSFIFLANSQREQRVAHLDKFENYLELVKLDIRLSFDLQCINVKKHAQLSQLLESIGKQVTGWKKSAAQ